MSDDNKNEPVHYEYDGIVEHNNPMPAWWTWKFILTVIFAFIYFIHYQIADGPTLQDELKQSMTELEKLKNQSKSVQVTFSENDLAGLSKNPQAMASAKSAFAAKCAMCHGENLEGKIGPNLTDKFWIHGDGKIASIMKVIKEGVPAKGMPPWEASMSDEEVAQVSAYIISKKGSNPAQAKAHEGIEYND